MPVRFPATQKRVSVAAHPKLSERHTKDVQGGGWSSGRCGICTGLGRQASISLAFNDAMWEEYATRRVHCAQGRGGDAVHANVLADLRRTICTC